MFNDYRFRMRGIFIATAVLAVFFLAFPAWAPTTDGKKKVLVIGKVSSNPKKHYRYLKPMADYAVRHMKDLGIEEAQVLMARDNEQMIEYLKEGKVDWVTETPFLAVLFEEETGAEIILRKWKKGVPEYHTVFVTIADSKIHNLEDLKGKLIAFQDEGSTSAFLVPAALLIDRGLSLVELGTPREDPPADKVGYFFAKEEFNMTTLLHKGLVDALAYSNLDWEKSDHTPEYFKRNFRIFHETRPYPRAVELVRAGLDPRVKQRLREVLLKAHDDPKAAKVLKMYQKTRKFDEITNEIRSQLDQTRRIMKTVEKHFE